ncbi:MAG: hypothetical protein IJ370_07995 [Oscillospiraceae bacterium]|nr:hypothetical protein [Oscillospiraceae bacterium]
MQFFKSNLSPLSKGVRIALSASALVCFAVFFIVGPFEMLSARSNADAVFILAVSLLILAFCSLFFTFKFEVKNELMFASFLVVAAAAIALRLYVFDAVSTDYTNFLSRWLAQMRLLPGVEPITTPIGDYNMPYLYYLFFISRTNLYDLYMIKILSVVFDFVLALGSVKLVRLYSKNDVTALLAFFGALFAPTLFLNSAYWAQCDGIYTALSVLALYFALSKRPKTSIVFFALAFSFKMQAIFILPVIIFLVLKHKISLKHLVWFPVTFFLTLIPSLLCGRSFYDTFSIYLDQTSSYPELTLNCPTFWALFSEYDFDIFGTAALFLAGAAVFIFIVFVANYKDRLNDTLLFDAAFILVLLMPFFLPRMHERYFYLAEALSLIYVLIHTKRLFVSPLVLFTGYCVYSAFIFGKQIFGLEFLAVINAAVIIYVIKKFVDDIKLVNTENLCDKKECC